MPHKFSENESLENLTTVDENLRPYYEQVSEGAPFTIRPELRGAAGAWDGVNDVNHKLRKQTKKSAEGAVDLSPLSEYGTTVSEISETLTSRFTEMSDTIESKKDAVNPAKIRQQMTEAHTTAMGALQSEMSGIEKQMHQLLIGTQAQKSIAQLKGNAKFLLPEILSNTRIDKEERMVNGQPETHLVARVYDKDGDIRIGPTGGEMTIHELAESFKKDPEYALLFESEVRSGGGPNPRRSSVVQTDGGTKRTAAEKISGGVARIEQGGTL